VLAKGLDSNTAFEILSIDIADVDVGDNIGAKLQSEQADAGQTGSRKPKQKFVVQPLLPSNRKMRAKTQEMRAKVGLKAEALVPQGNGRMRSARVTFGIM
jgi:uncharacterized protein YqfA (UPF0365 family)